MSTETKPFKPSIPFLTKVKLMQVGLWFGYSPRRGGYHTFRGGQAAYEKHRKAGYVKAHGAADLGRPAIVELTEEGRAALAKAVKP